MQYKLLSIGLAICLLSLTACAGFLGPGEPPLSPEDQAAQEKAQAEFEGLLDFSYENSAESVVLAACTDLYDFGNDSIDYVQIMQCYHEQVIVPEAQAQSGPRDLSPRDLSPKSLAPRDLSPKTQ